MKNNLETFYLKNSFEKPESESEPEKLRKDVEKNKIDKNTTILNSLEKYILNEKSEPFSEGFLYHSAHIHEQRELRKKIREELSALGVDFFPKAEELFYIEKVQEMIKQKINEAKIKKIIPRSQHELIRLVKGKDLYNQKVIISAAIENKIITIDDLIRMFEENLDGIFKLAVLDEIYHFAEEGRSEEERTKTIIFLSDFLNLDGKNFSKPKENTWQGARNLSDTERHYINILNIGNDLEKEATEILKTRSFNLNNLMKAFAVNSLKKNKLTLSGEEKIIKNIKNILHIFQEVKNNGRDIIRRTTSKLDCYPEEILEENFFILAKSGGEMFINELPNLPDSKSVRVLLERRNSPLFKCIKKIAEKNKRLFLSKAVEKMISAPNKKNFREYLLILFASIVEAEDIRTEIDKKLNNIDKKRSEYKNLKYIRSLITPNSDKIAITNLQNFYQSNIKFEEYAVNQKMNEGEVALLEELIGKQDKTLEMGCGTGRLIKELAKKGYDIAGYDFTARHVEITQDEIKKSGQEPKVFQCDWHNNALKDESFDKVYSLGRNILHDYSLVDQVQLFREAARILRPGGEFIFDIPDREKGSYKKMVEGYAQEMQKRGIRNFRYGAIYDSPDGKNFATRYAYSPEDIRELAAVSGFKIVRVENKPLETGDGDENLYYILEKTEK